MLPVGDREQECQHSFAMSWPLHDSGLWEQCEDGAFRCADCPFVTNYKPPKWTMLIEPLLDHKLSYLEWRLSQKHVRYRRIPGMFRTHRLEVDRAAFDVGWRTLSERLVGVRLEAIPDTDPIFTHILEQQRLKAACNLPLDN